MNKEKTTFQVRDLRKRLNRALKKKQQLNKRIMKAIEYIEKYSIMYEQEVQPYKVIESEELLDILRGDEE